MREEILQKAYDALESTGRPRCQNTFNAETCREERVNLNTPAVSGHGSASYLNNNVKS
jgi:hypothetical protein